MIPFLFPRKYRAGIDENGLGPRLGPLVVTGVWMEGELEAERLREALAVPFDVQDSKRIFSSRSLARGEMAALAVLRALTGELVRDVGTLSEVLGSAVGRMARPCEACGEPGLCDPGEMMLPLWADEVEIEERGGRLRDACEAQGMLRGGVETAVLCAWELNERFRAGENKLDVDLATFLEVGRRMRGRWNGEGLLVCGRIGNRKAYAGAMEDCVVVEETRERSHYVVKGVGEVAFVLDADDSDPLVSMASLVGKYVRELAMESIWRNVTARIPGLRRPSGYRDPVTAAFVEASAEVLDGVPEGCVERSR